VDFKPLFSIWSGKPAYLGLLSGLLTCFYFLVFYFIDKPLFFQTLIFWGSFLVLFSFYGLTVLNHRNRPFPFITALRSFFLIFFFNSALYYIFYFILNHIVDPNLVDIQYQVIRDGLESNAMLSETAQQAAWNISKEELIKNLRANALFFSFMQGLPAGFLLSLVLAYFFKKE
jgi:hypothetical protein